MKMRRLALARRYIEIIAESSELSQEIEKLDKKIIKIRNMLRNVKVVRSVKSLKENIKNKRIYHVRKLHYIHRQNMITLQQMGQPLIQAQPLPAQPIQVVSEPAREGGI